MPRKKKQYDPNNLLEAVAAVKNGMTYKAASEKYGIPASTINDKCLHKYRDGKNKPGAKCYNQFVLFLCYIKL